MRKKETDYEDPWFDEGDEEENDVSGRGGDDTPNGTGN